MWRVSYVTCTLCDVHSRWRTFNVTYIQCDVSSTVRYTFNLACILCDVYSPCDTKWFYTNLFDIRRSTLDGSVLTGAHPRQRWKSQFPQKTCTCVQCDVYSIRRDFNVTYNLCYVHSMKRTFNVTYIKCDAHSMWCTFNVSYMQCDLHQMWRAPNIMCILCDVH